MPSPASVASTLKVTGLLAFVKIFYEYKYKNRLYHVICKKLTLALSSPVTFILFILYALQANGLPSTGWSSIKTSIICLPGNGLID